MPIILRFPVFEFNCLYTARLDISFQGKNVRYTMEYHVTATFNTGYEATRSMQFLVKSNLLLCPREQTLRSLLSGMQTAHQFFNELWSSCTGHWLHQRHQQECEFWSWPHGLPVHHTPSWVLDNNSTLLFNPKQCQYPVLNMQAGMKSSTSKRKRSSKSLYIHIPLTTSM